MSVFAELPDLSVLLLWGFAATMVMTIILYGSQAAGLSRLSFPLILGTCLTADRDRAHLLGFLAYLAGGWAFAFVYAGLFTQVGTSWQAGTIAGFVHGSFLLLVLLPVMPHLHPRMASEYDGPDQLRRLEPPGFLGLNYGYRTPLTTLLAQTSYGAMLGAFLPG